MIQLVFLERTPATKCQRTRRLQNSAEGGKRRDRIVEGHHTESREHGIRAFRRQIQVLSVCLDQPHLTERLGPAPGDFKEQGGDVHADHLPLRSDPLGELEIESARPRTRYREQCLPDRDPGLRWPSAPREKAEGQSAHTPRRMLLRGGALEMGCSLNLGQALEIRSRRKGAGPAPIRLSLPTV